MSEAVRKTAAPNVKTPEFNVIRNTPGTAQRWFPVCGLQPLRHLDAAPHFRERMTFKSWARKNRGQTKEVCDENSTGRCSGVDGRRRRDRGRKPQVPIAAERAQLSEPMVDPQRVQRVEHRE